MLEDVETMNFRKLKCNNHKVSFCFNAGNPNLVQDHPRGPQEEQNKMGFSVRRVFK